MIDNDQTSASDVVIDKIIITNHSGTSYNLIAQCLGITVVEDIFSPTITAEIGISDSIGLLTTFPIVGGEKIELSFHTPGRKTYDLELYIGAVTDVRSIDNQTTSTYSLLCVTDELLQGINCAVEESYNTTIDEMVKHILTKYLKTKRPLFYEKTKGIQHIVFTRQSGFSAIDLLAKRAKSLTNQSSSFLFYQNKHGFNFNTLEQLMEQNQQVIEDKIVTKAQVLADKFENKDSFRQLVQYAIGQQFNLIDLLKLGSLNNIHQSFDLIPKRVRNSEYKMTDVNKFSTVDGNRPLNIVPMEFYNRYATTSPARTFAVVDSSQHENYIRDFITNKLGYVGTQLNRTMDIIINGDSEITSGDAIAVMIPKISADDKNQTAPEPMINGNYLVSRVTHDINVQDTATGATYNQTLQLIRGTYIV